MSRAPLGTNTLQPLNKCCEDTGMCKFVPMLHETFDSYTFHLVSRTTANSCPDVLMWLSELEEMCNVK